MFNNDNMLMTITELVFEKLGNLLFVSIELDLEEKIKRKLESDIADS